MKEIDLFYFQLDEPFKIQLMQLRQHILALDKDMTETWKFNMPFFFYKGNRFCYFRLDKKKGMYYIGFNDGKWVGHPDLIFEERTRIKIFLLDPAIGLPFKTIDSIIQAAISIYD